MATRIYTRSGDDGETGLFGGDRVLKNSRRVEAYGAVDELNAALGVAAAAAAAGGNHALEQSIRALQVQLFQLGADIATPGVVGDGRGSIRIERVSPEAVEALESSIDTLDAALPPLAAFILPGGSGAAAALHFARTVCRRAERHVVALSVGEPINREVVRYLNRLSDLLFVMARAANAAAGVEDVPWKP